MDVFIMAVLIVAVLIQFIIAIGHGKIAQFYTAYQEEVYHHRSGQSRVSRIHETVAFRLSG